MAKLGDICDIKSGGTPSRTKQEYWNGNIPWVKISDFTSKYIDKTSEFITDEGLNNSSAKIVQKGSILFTVFATLGEVAILNIEATTNQAIAALTINNPEVNNDYLYYCLTSLKEYVNNIGRGVAQNNINLSILRDMDIPLPPLETQRKIAATLDKVTRTIDLCNAILEKLDLLVKARFVEMFGKGNFKTCKLKDVCTKITDGTHKTPTYLSEGITFISAKNIVNGKLDFADVKYISKEEFNEIQKRCQTEIYDILLSKSGSLGSPTVLRTNEPLGLFESLAIIKYDRSKLLSEFLCEQLKTDAIQRQFKTGTKGVAIKHLHLNVIGSIDIIVPPIDLQQQFAAFVAQTDKSKLAVKKVLEKAETLKKALMQEYFG